MPLRTFLAFVLSLASFVAHADVEVMPLNNRPAADVLPIVQSVLGNQGNAEAYGNQLIVNSNPGRLRDVRQLLERLDTAPRRLRVTLDTRGSVQTDTQGYAVSGGAGGVRLGEGGNGARIVQYGTENGTEGMQQVQVTEGYPAMIQAGQRLPFTTGGTDTYGRYREETRYRDVTRGFYVTVSTTGDIVHVLLSSNQDRVDRADPRATHVQSSETRLTGRLGEWITVGGVAEQRSDAGTGLVKRYGTQGRDDMSLRLRVDPLD